MLNEDQIMGKWKEIKAGVRTLWAEISDDELEKTKGNLGQISGLVQQKYGDTKELIKERMDRLMASFDNDTDKTNFSTDSFARKPVDLDDEFSADLDRPEKFNGHRSIIETNKDQAHRI